MSFLWRAFQYVLGICLILAYGHFVWTPRQLNYKNSKLENKLAKREREHLLLELKLSQQLKKLEEELREQLEELEKLEQQEIRQREIIRPKDSTKVTDQVTNSLQNATSDAPKERRARQTEDEIK